MQAVKTISTLQADAALQTSMELMKTIPVENAASRDIPLRRIHPYIVITIAIVAIADGRREEYSSTPPVINEQADMHQARKGGLYGMSVPKLTGNIQLPVFSIATATIASRGSPFVLNRVSPSQGKNITQLTINRKSHV